MRQYISTRYKSNKPQRGFIAFALLTLILSGSAIVALNSSSANLSLLATNQADTAKLQNIKKSLLAYASIPQKNIPWRPGTLPCPDSDNDGIENKTGTACTVSQGWLPFLTLNLSDIRDSSKERFWYSVTPTYANTALILQNHTPPTLTLMTPTPAHPEVIAVVIAPGTAVGAQSTRINHTLTPCPTTCAYASKYLEGRNSDSNNTTFEIRKEFSNEFNDQLITLKPADLWPITERFVLKEAKNALLKNKTCNGGNLPDPAPITLLTPFDSQAGLTFGKLPLNNPTWQNCAAIPTEFKSALSWFYVNFWYQSIFYTRNTSGINIVNKAGLQTAALIASGPDLQLPSQRPSTQINHYLEDENVTPNDNQFKHEFPFKDYALFNDLIEVVE